MSDRKPTPPQDPSEAEREHCIKQAYALCEQHGLRMLTANDISDLLLRERAAADKAGYERGFAAGRELPRSVDRTQLADRDRRIAELERELADINDRARERGEHAE